MRETWLSVIMAAVPPTDRYTQGSVGVSTGKSKSLECMVWSEWLVVRRSLAIAVCHGGNGGGKPYASSIFCGASSGTILQFFCTPIYYPCASAWEPVRFPPS